MRASILARLQSGLRQVLVVAVFGLLVGCRLRIADREGERLSKRIDSLIGVVASVQASLQNQPRRPEADTLTVETVGAGATGHEDAPVIIVEFTDYQCPFCAKHQQLTMPRLKEAFIDKGIARYVVKDMPLPFHPAAMPAAKAARCAADQGTSAFWQFHDALFQAQPQLADTVVNE